MKILAPAFLAVILDFGRSWIHTPENFRLPVGWESSTEVQATEGSFYGEVLAEEPAVARSTVAACFTRSARWARSPFCMTSMERAGAIPCKD